MGLDKEMPGTVLQCLERQFPQDIVRYHHDSVFAVENASGRPQQESEKLACRLINAETVIRNSCAKLIDLFRKSLAADDDRVCGYPRSAADELILGLNRATSAPEPQATLQSEPRASRS